MMQGDNIFKLYMALIGITAVVTAIAVPFLT